MLNRKHRMMSTFGLLLQIHLAFSYTKTSNDYDLYGIKVAMNDYIMVSVDNLNMVWYVIPVVPNNSIYNAIAFNETSCDFVYSVVVPVWNISSFVYNCIDYQGRNVIGHFVSSSILSFSLADEQIVSNYSTQDNFIIDIDGQDAGVYGFADDFMFYYELNPAHSLTIWSNTWNMSPRALDIGSNVDYGVIIGYCQITSSLAQECAFIIQLNKSLSYPVRTNEFSIQNYIQFPYSDPRTNHHITQSRLYSAQTVLSIAITWRTRRVLIGIPSLNIVLLYSFDNPQNLAGSRQNGLGLMGFGKGVAWLDDQGEKAVIIANKYVYSSYQWISSSIHVYDIQSDGFTDGARPILIYPNSQQILFPWINPSFLRLSCSASGHVTIFDLLGNAAILFAAPAGTYPSTNSDFYTSIIVSCIRGTYRNYTGIELCFPCPEGTYSSDCLPCRSNDSFCPFGSVEEIAYSTFESNDQDQDYPESPENIVFDDILMQNMFSFNVQSIHCLLVSPITWVFVVIMLSVIIAIVTTIHEYFGPGKHNIRDWIKQILRKVDLIGEGQLWIGGLVSAAIVVLIVSAYVFSSKYTYEYPLEQSTSASAFACDVSLRNAKFSTTLQKLPSSRSATKDIQAIFDLLNLQSFTLNIDLVQTAFTCDDTLFVQRFIGYTETNLTISSCETRFNDSILSLAIRLPVQEISLQVTLLGLKTIGAIRLGLYGSGSTTDNKRYKLMSLNFSSTFVPLSINQVLASATLFSLQLTQNVNRTAPLSTDGYSTYSAMWSPSFNVNTDELFSEETRHTLFQRMYTNISITIEKSIFYVSNVQEPIARRTEIIFHNLLFTIVVLELFGLFFLIFKLLLFPLMQSIIERISTKKCGVISKDLFLSKIVINKTTPAKTDQLDLDKKSYCEWSTVVEDVEKPTTEMNHS
ncbi:unnamed protein product [Adineta ricciae]|uniref:Uncharacterized protein n=1 Tax=Adineta ricciae TaxID=249248 RepID=A0A815WHD3_ADIRI|nr:unnamed protein product [Adineta ricciae]